jgi:hypothetical protein
MMHDLAPGTKHAIDIGTLGSAGVTGAWALMTPSNFVLALTGISLMLNITWMILKFLYLRKHGADAMWGAGND